MWSHRQEGASLAGPGAESGWTRPARHRSEQAARAGVHLGGALSRRRVPAPRSGPREEQLDQGLVSILLPLVGGTASSSAHHLRAKGGIRRVYQGLARVHRALGVLSRSHGRFFTVSKGLGSSQPSCPAGNKAQESSLESHITFVRSGCISTGSHGHLGSQVPVSRPPPAKASRRVSVSCTNSHNMPSLLFSASSATTTAA